MENGDDLNLPAQATISNHEYVSNIHIQKCNDNVINSNLFGVGEEPIVKIDANLEEERGVIRENNIIEDGLGEDILGNIVKKANTTIEEDGYGKDISGCDSLNNNLREASSTSKGFNIEEGEFVVDLGEIEVTHLLEGKG